MGPGLELSTRSPVGGAIPRCLCRLEVVLVHLAAMTRRLTGTSRLGVGLCGGVDGFGGVEASVPVLLAVSVAVVFFGSVVDAVAAGGDDLFDLGGGECRVGGEDECDDAGNTGACAGGAAEGVGVVSGPVALGARSRVVAGVAGAVGGPDSGGQGRLTVAAGEAAPDSLAGVAVG